MPLLLGIVHAKSHRGGVRLRLDPLTIERMLTGAFRRQRMAQFARLFGVTNTTTILDIGGSTYIWSFLDIKPRVTCLNLEGNDPRPRREGNIELVSGDGRCLAYPDQSFDIAFSNSVIEQRRDRIRHAQTCQ